MVVWLSGCLVVIAQWREQWWLKSVALGSIPSHYQLCFYFPLSTLFVEFSVYLQCEMRTAKYLLYAKIHCNNTNWTLLTKCHVHIQYMYMYMYNICTCTMHVHVQHMYVLYMYMYNTCTCTYIHVCIHDVSSRMFNLFWCIHPPSIFILGKHLKCLAFSQIMTNTVRRVIPK